MMWHSVGTESQEETALKLCRGSSTVGDGFSTGYSNGDGYGNGDGEGFGYGYGFGNGEGTNVPSSCGDIWGGGESPE
jgi:hypothetical protein